MIESISSNPNVLRFLVRGTTANQNDLQVNLAADLPLFTWHHLVAVRQGNTNRLYLNGVQLGQQTAGANVDTGTGGAAFIGRLAEIPDRFFPGRIDEVSLYNRALTDVEVQSIFNAGITGKLKDNTTPTGSNVAVNTKSDATVTFPTVSSAGTTQQIPLNPALFPSLPTGSTTAGLTYDIATNAIFTGSPQVCFNLPSITTSGAFGNLRILHLENNAWIPRTGLINFSTRTLCTSGLTALSPFTIVNGAPTAAGVSVGGRVSTASGRGINKARISLTNANGETRTALTNPFGFYQFADVGAGESYIISASSKAHEFAAPTQLLTVTEATNSVNFTAIEGMQKLPQ